jgi:hypothetical protein
MMSLNWSGFLNSYFLSSFIMMSLNWRGFLNSDFLSFFMMSFNWS